MANFQISFMSEVLLRTVSFQAILPVDKITRKQPDLPEDYRFKTLYLFHGIFGSNEDWLVGTRIQRYAMEHNLAVIMPSGENSFYIDNYDSGNMYGEYFGEELVKITRKMFPLSNKREDTFIGGLSMGGYGALRNGLKNNDTFGRIVALSSALMVEPEDLPEERKPVTDRSGRIVEACFRHAGEQESVRALARNLMAHKSAGEEVNIPEIYLAVGTEDPIVEKSREYHAFLNSIGYGHTYEEGLGTHDWIFWDKYIEKAMDWLPLDKGTTGLNSGNVQE